MSEPNRSANLQDPLAELTALLLSNHALIILETREEQRALELLRRASLNARRKRDWGVFQWTVTEGLQRIDRDLGGPLRTVADPTQFLRHLKATPAAGIYVLLDFHPYLADPVNVRMLKDVAQGYGDVARTVVLISHHLELPGELDHFAARLTLNMPTLNERRMIVTRAIADFAASHNGIAPPVDKEAESRLLENLAGLSASDCERLVRQALAHDGAITSADLPRIMAAKFELLNRNGTLTYEPDTARFADIGGLHRLRQWLQARKPAFDGSAADLEPPKGVLLLGVQGCGKSLAAKAAAGVFGVPLLRFDFAALYNKWHGESERNLRESLSSATALAPCVLWIDEIEKAIATGDGEGGTSRRVLGSLLTWLAENQSRVFVVATANDIAALPAELLRKGRFDEIFFVDLPGADARQDILRIHTGKRGIELAPNQLAALARHCEHFSGAEIEQAVVAARYAAHASGSTVSAQLIARELVATRPLAVVMAEKVAALRNWARDRTVSAD
ncbi:MAG: AAA family ATPase [Steroidobacteraceae bacterium]